MKALCNILLPLVIALASITSISAQDSLPSWNDAAPKRAIVAFVEKVTKEGSPDFVPVAGRIATFDNDGTLWCEKPLPVQLFFALDRVKELAPQHPELSNGLTLSEGKMHAKLTNGKGVTMYVSGETEGLASSVGVQTFQVTLKD